MSNALLSLTKKYLTGQISPTAFASKFISDWKYERDSGLLLQDDPALGELLSDIFSLADNFNANEDRRSYEFDDVDFFKLISDCINRPLPPNPEFNVETK